MKRIGFFLTLWLSTVFSLPRTSERIVGGSLTNINTYPFAASLQASHNNINFWHSCGGTIINNRSILSAAHCWHQNPQPNRSRVRVGSSHFSGGGRLHNIAQFISHPNYRSRHDSDIGVIRVTPYIPLDAVTLHAGFLAPANIHIPDNSNVFAIGWGQTTHGGSASDQLRHVQLLVVNQARCNNDFRGIITANMICAGWTSAGRGICFGDSGTALVFDSNTIVGVSSFIHGAGCGAHWPDVFTRVSPFVTWIRNVS